MRLLLTALVALAAAGAAAGQNPPPIAVSASTPPPPPLERRVGDLERRVAALEAARATPAPAPIAAAAPQPRAATPCGCKFVGGTCPTTGFCAGAGCDCTQAAYQTVPTLPAPGVAAPSPFADPPAVLYTTPATTVRTAGTRLLGRGRNAAPAPSGGLTYTLVPGAASGGITSGCANGRCATQSGR